MLPPIALALIFAAWAAVFALAAIGAVLRMSGYGTAWTSRGLGAW